MKKLIKVFIPICILIVFATCKKEEVPILTTSEITNINGISASSGGIITDDGHAKVTSRGVCWSTIEKPTIANSKTTDGNGTGSFTSSITGLTQGTNYYLRAYATNSVGTGYGNEIPFTTTTAPSTVSTSEITSITPLTATSGGSILSDGGSSVSARGVCWNTSPDPTIDNLKTIDGTGIGIFTSLITGLSDGTKYYLRAYATNNNGTTYGNILTFTTPTFSTQSNFKPTGVIPATESQLLAIPTIESIDTSIVPSFKGLQGLPDHNFIKVPTPGNQYSHNSCTAWTVGYGMLGQAFNVIEGYENYIGNDRNFSPSYIWNQLNHGLNIGITITQAIDLVKKEGCCKITYMQPDAEIKYQPTADAKANAAQFKISTPYYRFSSVNDIDGMKFYLSKNYPIMICINIDETFKNDQFEKAPDGRSVWKKYNNKILFGWHSVLICGYDDALHAFKILNSWGTNWGDNGFVYIDYDFFKSIVLGIPGIGPEIYIAFVQRPILSTYSITEINAQTAKCGGTIYSDWNYPIMQRGVCWSTAIDPTIINNKTTDGSGKGSYVSALTGLSANTKYYVKAYATNSQGTSYGYQVSFTTLSNNPPSLPSAPNPTNGGTGVSTTPTLTWTCSDPENDPMTFDVYFGNTSNPTTLVGSNLTTMSYSPSVLNFVATYFWKVVAKDNHSNSTPGPVWSFTTQNSGGSGIIFNPNLTYGSVSDNDGNTYKTIQIGTQTWMAENLKTSKYSNGDIISSGLNNSDWSTTSSGAYSFPDNDNNNNLTYGKLYNWQAVVDSRNVCPTGWHVPSDAEWSTLTTNLGGESVSGIKLKETGTTHWLSPNTGVTNEAGFTGLPGGIRNYAGTYYNIGNTGYWWSTTGFDSPTTAAWARSTVYNSNNMLRGGSTKGDGLSVRCIKADATGGTIPTNGLIAYYPFNGNANDESGNGNNGTIIGATLSNNRFGEANKAFHFDGGNQYITIPNSTSLNTPIGEISIIAWVNTESGGTNSPRIFRKGNTGYDLCITPTSGLRKLVYYPNSGINYNNQQPTSSISFSEGIWHQVVITESGTTVSFYIDGVTAGTSTSALNILGQSSSIVTIGRKEGGTDIFKGSLDDILIYNRALSSEEIQSLYHAGGW